VAAEKQSGNAAERQSGNDALSVGIDLGTSRSAISSSNGDQFVIDSFVGWPADLVARKVLQRDLLIGREALDNRTMLDLHRPLERGLLKEGSEKDVEAARELLRHLLSLVSPKSGRRQPVRAVVGVPATAMRTNKQHLRNALKGVVDSLMIVSEPFAVAYGLNALLHTMIIDIGAGTTDFCVMKGRYPTDDDQRSLTTAGDSIDTQLMKLIQTRYPTAAFTVFMVREWKEKSSFVGEPPESVVVTVPVSGVPTRIDITHEMRTACESIVAPIV
jgi:rod shape-determining protein MreB